MLYDLSCNYNYFYMIDWDAPRQKFLTRRTPIDQKLNLRKWRNWLFFENKNLNFESVAGISVRNFDRKFRQHNGDSMSQMFWNAVWWNSIKYSRRYSYSKPHKNGLSARLYHVFSSKVDADESKSISRGLGRRPTSLCW